MVATRRVKFKQSPSARFSRSRTSGARVEIALHGVCALPQLAHIARQITATLGGDLFLLIFAPPPYERHGGGNFSSERKRKVAQIGEKTLIHGGQVAEAQPCSSCVDDDRRQMR